MTPAIASDLFRSALRVTLLVSFPILAAMTLAAVVFGVLQAATQVQDSSVSFAPKLAAAAAVAWLAANWMVASLAAFMHKALLAIPWVVAR
jgi:flagellar biosynthetic protein FliQ